MESQVVPGSPAGHPVPVGRRVVVETDGPDGREEIAGILKEYSEGYLEVLDVRYPSEEGGRVVDLILPRPAASLRHGGEFAKARPEGVELKASDDRASTGGD